MRIWGALLLCGASAMLASATAPDPRYGEGDFDKVAKFDAHVHANVEDPRFLEVARRDGFHLLAINVDYPDFPPLPLQARVAQAMRAADPQRLQFATTFSMQGFGTPGWTERTIRAIDDAVAKGAVAVKVWKNIGMVAEDAQGKRVFIDDPRFDGVIAHLEQRRIPLIVHQGEPKNCWLPLDQMTTENDRAYFKAHPEYYMYLHPEEPSYEALMAARDRFVARHPKLAFDGAHMASLEWSVDELAAFLDRYPNAMVDLAARMSNLQAQSVGDRDRVRNFFVKYQDRVLYGTDLTDSPPDPAARAQNPPATDDFAREADRVWRNDWRYLATPLGQRVDAIKADAAGLDLPRAVIDKIYWKNAQRFFGRGR
ncbi:amidohydrolase family protein [Sphingomonas sp. DG1-23]|uniref:amidohydrolase family protein n=1 Tax=Sphingomonas sp. DG1-23 TaxID=3068316 RepID=UPI00274004C1|nr:amidohydrolase family protein [Sphingomonas sp. DG1-23]MDP5277535.1 amidohydrolase family protein [Sphingomonas sp. DG1-23]